MSDDTFTPEEMEILRRQLREGNAEARAIAKSRGYQLHPKLTAARRDRRRKFHRKGLGRKPWWFERVLARLFGHRFKHRPGGMIIRHWRGEFYIFKPLFRNPVKS